LLVKQTPKAPRSSWHPSYLCMLQSVLSEEAGAKTHPDSEHPTGKCWEGCGANRWAGEITYRVTQMETRRNRQDLRNFIKRHSFYIFSNKSFCSQSAHLLGSKAGYVCFHTKPKLKLRMHCW